MVKFKKNDLVSITDPGHVYTHYSIMFTRLRFKNRKVNILHEHDPKKLFVVAGTTMHEYDWVDKQLCKIVSGDIEVLISARGIKKIAFLKKLKIV